MEEQEVIGLCGQVGKLLLENGAETSRVERTAEYIGQSAGVPVSCHATMTAVFVDANSGTHTHLVKVRTKNFNLRKVDAVNTLSRQFTAGQIDFAALREAIAHIDHTPDDFNLPLKILGAGLVSVAPMLLFQASWRDLGLAFFVGIAGYLAAMWADTHVSTPYIASGIGGVVIGLLATTLQLLAIGNSADNIIVSALMPLVPGVAITNSLRELIGKETISGAVRAIDAVLTAGAIGGGVVVGSAIIKGLLGGVL